jgi:hypothetical protein
MRWRGITQISGTSRLIPVPSVVQESFGIRVVYENPNTLKNRGNKK